MNTSLRTMLIAATLVAGGAALAAERTVTLDVENVSCVTCAPIVRRTLARLPGVNRVVVAEQAGAATATVSFDDGRITAEALKTAVTNAGFPAHMREN